MLERKIFLGDTAQAAGYLSVARGLVSYARAMKLSVLRRRVGAALIIVRPSSHEDYLYIHVEPSGGAIELVFTDGVALIGYRYTVGDFMGKLASANDARLLQIYPKGIAASLGVNAYAVTDQILARDALGSYPLQSYLPSYSGAIGVNGSSLDWLTAAGAVPLVSIPERGFSHLVPQSAFAMLASNANVLWNQLAGPYVWQIPPANPEGAISAWHWQPRIWHPDKEDLLYAAGLHYGAVGYSTYGPCKEIHVKFGGLLDGRYGDDFGYCEVLKQLSFIGVAGDAVESKVEAWFTLKFQDVGRGYFSDAGDWGIRFIQNSVKEAQPKPSFVIDMQSYFSTVPDIHFWATRPPIGGDTSTPLGTYGVLATSESGTFVLYAHRRYLTVLGESGVTETINAGGEYKSHSLSADGALVAILSGKRIFVYNMITRKVLRDTEYDSLQAHASVVFPPQALPKADQHTPVVPGASVIGDMDTPEMSPALGGVLQYYQPASWGTGTRGWKVLCTDGVTAIGKLWSDTCWRWTATSIKPTNSKELTRTHSVTIEGVLYEAGSFFGLTEQLPYLLSVFAGTGALFQEIILAKWSADGTPLAVGEIASGENTNVGTIKRANISLLYGFGVSSGGPDYYTPSDNAIGPFLFTATGGMLKPVPPATAITVDTTQVLFVPTEPICEDRIGTVEVIDACGEFAKAEVIITGPEKLTIQQTDTGVQIRGGLPPYSVTMSCGSYDEATGDVDATGCCGTGTATVVDDCGHSAICDFKFPSGAWVDSGDPRWAGAVGYTNPDGYLHYVYASTTSRTALWLTQQCCFEHSDELPQFEPSVCSSNIQLPESNQACTSAFAPYGGIWYAYDGHLVFHWDYAQDQVWSCP